MTATSSCDIGIVGLGVMGENLALNFARNGYTARGFDVDEGKCRSFAQRTQGGSGHAMRSLEELVRSLPRPRRLLMMVPAGAPVDVVLADLRRLLEPGDVVVDGGNSLYTDTRKRMVDLEGTGILYVGMGVSGGEEGALLGPALMPGGDAQAWPLLRGMLQAVAAKAPDGRACCEWIGPGGSGHFVKMVHNGIEYADMQTICESYWLLARLLGMSPAQMAPVFARWNEGELESYLVAITADILRRDDEETGRPMVDVILDTAEQKGTGKWTSQAALDMGVTAPTIADAVFARTVSAIRHERLAASRVLQGPQPSFGGDPAAFTESVRRALLASKICAYAQGFQLLRAADAEHQWDLKPGDIAATWRAGCIIRARLLEDIRRAFERDPKLANLLVDPDFAGVMAQCQQALREVVAAAAQHGIAIPAFMSALSYYDAYRSERLPANLLQAQRDYFGAHTYQRVDKPGKFHTRWT